ncbi:hypothetical protein SAMN05444161_8832 [Rhizobiales bacterium GAS191]|nr:hypothetical protein SAMN05444161_8832 [Rhizobiales bacterium GAS191]
MIDRSTKILLTAIAVGLWANLAVGFFRPAPAIAQVSELSGIATDLRGISSGTCNNRKIC